jgi:glycosyltransferase involved in cell wall biosynthesis
MPSEIVLIIDGPISRESEGIIAEFKSNLGDVLVIIRNNIQMGLAFSLNKGLKITKNNIIARMDADDISLPKRFEIQYNYLLENSHIDVVGSFISEVSLDLEKTYSVRKVPQFQQEIKQKIKFSNPISHPSVMFRKNSVLDVGGYPLFDRAQDYALWSKMIMNGKIFSNIPKILVKMRTGDDLFKRRNIRYFKSELAVFKYQKSIKLYGYPQFTINVVSRFLLRAAPLCIKKIVYQFREK